MLYNLYKEIYNLESPTSSFRSFRSAFKTLVFLYNYLLASIMKIEHPVYYYKNKFYYVLVDKYPVKILSVKCKGKNVSNEVSKYLGPMENFHGSRVSPNRLGYDELEFEYLDDEMNIISTVFKQNDIINI